MRDFFRRIVGRACLCAVLVVLAGLEAAAQPGPPRPPVGSGPAEPDASQRIVEAHRRVDSAVIDIVYAPYFSYPDETEFFISDYRVVFDRKGNRLRVDRPGYTMICDGTDILLVAESLPGRHLRAPLNGPLTFERLIEIVPDLLNPLPPAVILLLADPPMPWLSAGFSKEAKVFTPKRVSNDARLHLRMAVQGGQAELAFDDQSLLINEMLIRIDDKQLVGTGLDAMRYHYAFKWSGVDQPVDDELFKLDLAGSMEATTIAQFLAAPVHPAAAAAANGQHQQQQQAAGSLIGLTLPDMELDLLAGEVGETVNLSDLDEGVVVVEFFASWTRPSVLDLPALADFQAWCEKQEHHNVWVYTVAVGEKSKAMRKWLEALEQTTDREINLPVLLDSKTEAAMALRLPTVPRTLVLVDGKIVEVYGGVKPTFLDDLKKALPGWLELVKEKEPEKQKEEAEEE